MVRPLFLFSTLSVMLSAAGLLAAADVVKVDTGRLQGMTREGVVAFKGIPFAAPPVGELRWRAPQPAKAWKGVRPAAEYGADCMQKPFPGDAAPLGVTPAEDCLYVNVWVPERAPSKKMPVMVWIYGGGFVNGGSSPAVYDGSQFAKQGIAFVSFNYRLGRFGFFAHPALSKETPSGPLGNYAFLDQIAALQWVKRNIAAFGGDPANVTLFGESAGGGSVLTMMTSPLTVGLFHKAVIESGGGRSMLLGVRYVDRPGPTGTPSGESVGLAFAKANNIEGSDAAALAALRGLPAERVVAGLNMASMNTPTYAGPMVDGKVVVESPGDAYAAGHGMKIPIMVGATSADIGFPRGRTMEELFAPFGADGAKAKAAYDPDGTGKVIEVGVAMAADQMMVEPARYTARSLVKAGQPAYEFRFSYVAESMRGQWKRGAPHATEIPYVFDTVIARYGKDLTAADQAAARAANTYWVNFAKSGNPNGGGLPDWPAYKPETDMLMDFTLTGPVAKPDPWKARLDLIERLAEPKK
ncbi:carboxylesterase family protein [uncultured Paludibaculum sp.]|uniref:carboxylesterase/lipase family protein n=1 Tax=uncultured Paludibaculum sp. TaxID=1765020 RepID=UPI002AAA6306|nr:carboxylesterase family protein [uncultured Paludibaculum sp.]